MQHTPGSWRHDGVVVTATAECTAAGGGGRLSPCQPAARSSTHQQRGCMCDKPSRPPHLQHAGEDRLQPGRLLLLDLDLLHVRRELVKQVVDDVGGEDLHVELCGKLARLLVDRHVEAQQAGVPEGGQGSRVSQCARERVLGGSAGRAGHEGADGSTQLDASSMKVLVGDMICSSRECCCVTLHCQTCCRHHTMHLPKPTEHSSHEHMAHTST
jgi:hypothetical protein